MEARTAGWELLGLEPVTGDPASILSAADAYKGAARSAMGVTESLRGLAAGGLAAWSGSTADAYAAALRTLVPEASTMVEAATAAARALLGFAEVMRTMQDRAQDLLELATAAEDDRATAAQALTTLRAALASHAAEEQRLQVAWAAADAEADLAMAMADPTAPALQARAHALGIQRNDARAMVARTEGEISAAGQDLADASQRLDTARADAHVLAADFSDHAAATAAALQPVEPLHGGRFGMTGGAGPPPQIVVSAAAAAVHPAGGGGRPATAPMPATTAAVPAPSRRDPRGAGAVAVSAADMVRVSSVLEMARTSGAPVGVADLVPTRSEFDRFRRIGLQDVTARGAAMARAMGFDGTIGGLGWRPTPTDHSTGLAIDLMTYDDIATGEALAAFYREHHEELGVTYVIWNGRICSARDSWAWRPYAHPAGRTDATAMHLDHVHVSFDPTDNAYACACFGVAPR